MVACPKCVINSTLDSAFCKKCGAVLPVAVIEEEQEKLKEIVSKGMESYQAGNLEEAMAIAEHSILSNPTYGEAYALKGLVHERRAEYAEALDSYETVVALNPDSTIDKIKLNQLRNAFATRQAEPNIDRRGAIFVAGAAMLAVLAVGAVTYGFIQSSKENKQPQVASIPNNTANNNPFDGRQVGQDSNQPVTNPNGQRPNPGNHDDTTIGALGGDNTNKVADTSRRMGGGDRTRPNTYSSGFENTTVEPFNPGPINPNSNQLPNPKNKGGDENDPKTNGPGSGTSTPTPGGDTKVAANPPSDDSDHGVYQITASANNGNGTSRTNAPSSSTGKNYQRQGQNLARSGKISEAREAYQKAIDAFQSEISSGKGDKDAAQAGLNASRQALKNLKS